MSYIERAWTNIDDAEACMYCFLDRAIPLPDLFCVAKHVQRQKDFDTPLNCLIAWI